jgi:toxin ParE1/3/4
MRPIRFEPEAREELLAAIDWYEAREVGLGRRFLLNVRDAVGSIRETPEAWPLVARAVAGARRKLLDSFPYSVVFIVLPAEIRVIAVAHGHRRPGYWRKRIPGIRRP